MSERNDSDGSDQDDPTFNLQETAGVDDHVMEDEPDDADRTEDEQHAKHGEQSMDTDMSEQTVARKTPEKIVPNPVELPEYERNVAPKINCPEKIIIAVDMTSEVNTTTFIARTAPIRRFKR